MTLIVAALMPSAAVMAGDRLVTLLGKSVDPDFDKVCVAQNDGLRMVAGFTGIAYVAASTTGYGFHFVMTETLHRAICAGRTADDVLEAFRADLERQFARYRVPLAQCGIEVLCAGFDHGAGGWTGFMARIRNSTAGVVASSFRLSIAWEVPAVDAVGYVPAVRLLDLTRLRNAAEAGRPAPEVGGLAVSVISRAARHNVGRLLIGREYNLVGIPAHPDGTVISQFSAHGARVAKHPSFVTPAGIVNQTLITLPVDPRDHRRRSDDFRAAMQFSPRECPADSAAERSRKLQTRLDSAARETVQRYLIEHRDTVSASMRPTEVVANGGTSWHHATLPTDEGGLRATIRALLDADTCRHRPPGVACHEARRFVRGRRCVQCADWSNTYMAACATCAADVCTNFACPDLFGDPTHTLDERGDVRHLR